MRNIVLPQIPGLPIYEKYIPIGHPNRPGELLDPDIWEAICFHETANFNPSASDLMHVGYVGRAYKGVPGAFKEANGVTDFVYGAAQVFVDQDSVSCPIPLNERTHGAGDINRPASNGYRGQTKLAYERFQNMQNRKVLHIEMCDNADWVKVQSNTVEFVAQLLLANNVVPTEDYFIRHYDLTYKVCPSRFVNLDIVEIDPRWINFKARIISRYKELQAEQKQKNATPSDWLAEGAQYLLDRGYTKELHPKDQPVTIGLLGTILKNYDQSNKEGK